MINLINPVLRGWVNYFAVGHSSECFSFVKDWVEKKVRRHLAHARKRKGFGWERWSRPWLYDTLKLFSGYRVRRDRFFTVKREFSEKEAHYFLDIDFIKHVVLVAIADDNGRPTIVGGCRYIVMQPGVAEISFTVIDAYQGRGIGSALMCHIAALARKAGFKELVADVLAYNAPMLKVFPRSGLLMSKKLDGTTVDVTQRSPKGAITTSLPFDWLPQAMDLFRRRTQRRGDCAEILRGPNCKR